MTKNFQVGQDDFEILLNWLDSDREKAGQKYEFIRTRLIKIFNVRQCSAAEELADLTMDRVTSKIRNLSGSYQGEPALYFYAVAKKIFLEHSRKPKSEPLPETIATSKPDENLEDYHDCLDKCLTKLPFDQQQMIIEYYQNEKQVKIERRRKLARLFDISNETLRVRASRIRTNLQKCVLNCIEKNY